MYNASQKEEVRCWALALLGLNCQLSTVNCQRCVAVRFFTFSSR
ncbi:hypothetical protein [Microcoleus sp. CAWBG58]|nr:hypothetical protein [Microcoleus sp. CAWBG58]